MRPLFFAASTLILAIAPAGAMADGPPATTASPPAAAAATTAAPAPVAASSVPATAAPPPVAAPSAPATFPPASPAPGGIAAAPPVGAPTPAGRAGYGGLPAVPLTPALISQRAEKRSTGVSLVIAGSIFGVLGVGAMAVGGPIYAGNSDDCSDDCGAGSGDEGSLGLGLLAVGGLVATVGVTVAITGAVMMRRNPSSYETARVPLAFTF